MGPAFGQPGADSTPPSVAMDRLSSGADAHIMSPVPPPEAVVVAEGVLAPYTASNEYRSRDAGAHPLSAPPHTYLKARVDGLRQSAVILEGVYIIKS